MNHFDKPQLRKALPISMVLLCTLSCAMVSAQVLRDDPKRPVAEISRDLGVQPSEFRACFANVSPAPAGERPSAERVRSNKAKLLECLQGANPKITNESLDAVMDKYRPGGRKAQMPEKKQ
jgi:hypothetical protein